MRAEPVIMLTGERWSEERSEGRQAHTTLVNEIGIDAGVDSER